MTMSRDTIITWTIDGDWEILSMFLGSFDVVKFEEVVRDCVLTE